MLQKHFEDSQFELSRADGKRKLKPNAVLTLSDVPNPPPQIQTRRLLKDKNIASDVEMPLESTQPLCINDEMPTTSSISLTMMKIQKQMLTMKYQI
ncbi:hypothetical protein PPYR_11402 [Photinus pyralis]|uniref:Uncharacterized protein n=1 Tax=Photinus pyralis TaxID=7054 RepID=A0A5N4AB70_PHOPY|nr:hypothetical protein PPYR_11402 [Photinus pyralis]